MAFLSDIHGNLPALEAAVVDAKARGARLLVCAGDMTYALVHAGRDAAPHGRILRFEYDRSRTITALKKTSLPKDLRRDFTEGNKMRFLP